MGKLPKTINSYAVSWIHNIQWVSSLIIENVLAKIRSLPNEMMMCKICMSNVSCGSGEIVSDLYYIHYVAPLVESFISPLY